MYTEFWRELGKALTMVKFGYNNNYQSSIGMAPYEALYGRAYRSPLYWVEMGVANTFRIGVHT